jgi:hypothetical protein
LATARADIHAIPAHTQAHLTVFTSDSGMPPKALEAFVAKLQQSESGLSGAPAASALT